VKGVNPPPSPPVSRGEGAAPLSGIGRGVGGEVVVSLLLPARNEEALLPFALADLRAQTLREIEIIVIDDGSTDETAALARRAAEDDSRIRVIQTAGVGIPAALNLGLAEARGEFIARMDADDRCPLERLEKQVALLRARSELGLASCLIGPPPGERYAGGYAAYAEWVNSLVEPADIKRERFIECPVVHPTMLVRRDAPVAAGGWREGDFPEDYDLVLRLIERGVQIAKVPELLYYWRDRPQRASRIDPRYSPEAFAALKADYLSRGPLAGKLEIVVWGAGKISRRLVRPLQERGCRVVAWIDIDPRKLGRRRAGAPVLPPDELPNLRAYPLLIYVGSRGARELIRPRIRECGFAEGVDAWFCA
jgi:glycosyltransferase involved in cell wall biosynthesis